MKTKIDGLHTLNGQPKIVESYEELNKRLQLWYIERSMKRTTPEGTSESSTKKPRVNMIKTIDSREKENLYRLEETI